MDTLSNVSSRADGNTSANVGPTPDITLGDCNSQTGESVRYAHDPSKRWFVLRATYNRAQAAFNHITSLGIEAFYPVRHTLRLVNGKKRHTLVPLLPNILFVYAEPSTVQGIMASAPAMHYINYYYNHFKTSADGTNPPLTVPYDDMMDFIRITAVNNEHIMLVDQTRCHYKSGDTVEVTGGAFVGCRGRVARVAGQQRVVVEIDGLCIVATAYIPSAFIKQINKL